jgi:hypothetical protein
MIHSTLPITWVVYQRTRSTNNKELISNAVCEQSEWDVMVVREPQSVTLVQSGFVHESDAEKFARGTSGDTYRRPRTRK